MALLVAVEPKKDHLGRTTPFHRSYCSTMTFLGDYFFHVGRPASDENVWATPAVE